MEINVDKTYECWNERWNAFLAFGCLNKEVFNDTNLKLIKTNLSTSDGFSGLFWDKMGIGLPVKDFSKCYNKLMNF